MPNILYSCYIISEELRKKMNNPEISQKEKIEIFASYIFLENIVNEKLKLATKNNFKDMDFPLSEIIWH